MELILIGVAVSFNILIILFKYSRNRLADATLDLIILSIVTVVFVGSFNALVVGTIASSIVSVALLFNPPKLGVRSGVN